MTHENQREKEKQMENDRRDYACDPIVTEPGNGRSCFVAEYCSNAVDVYKRQAQRRRI